MGLKKTELLNDRVRITYNLQKPYGIPDVVDEVMEIFYAEIPDLPLAPKKAVSYAAQEERTRIFVPAAGKTISIIFSKYPETSSGPLEEIISGPYLEKNDR